MINRIWRLLMAGKYMGVTCTPCVTPYHRPSFCISPGPAWFNGGCPNDRCTVMSSRRPACNLSSPGHRHLLHHPYSWCILTDVGSISSKRSFLSGFQSRSLTTTGCSAPSHRPAYAIKRLAPHPCKHARTGPEAARRCQHRTDFGPVLACSQER